MLEIELIREMLPEKWDCQEYRLPKSFGLSIYQKEQYICDLIFHNNHISIDNLYEYMRFEWADPDFLQKFHAGLQKLAVKSMEIGLIDPHFH